MEIEINFKKLQKCLGDFMPLKKNDDGGVSISTSNHEEAFSRSFCSEKMFIEEIEDYIKDKGIEEFIASHMLNTQFIFPKH